MVVHPGAQRLRDPTRAASRGAQRALLGLVSLTDRFMGGQGAFQDELQDGMRQTLARVKQLAEG